MKKLIFDLKEKLKEVVEENKAEGLLFSGGLDTSILAVLCSDAIGVNVQLEEYGSDKKYAKILEDFLHLKIHYQTIEIDEAISAIPDVIKCLKSFDPAIPNDLAIYFGLKFAKKLGLKSIMTGDGSDELFAGYDYMKNIKNLDDYIKRISSNMFFSSNELGKFFNIQIKQPYLNKEFINFCLDIPKELKIKKLKKLEWGKWILRKAFEDLLPKEIIWQDKRPAEYGSGMTKLREIISSKISDDEFEEKSKSYPVKFISKDHLYYYEVYKDLFGDIPKPKDNEKECPYCKAGMNISSFHCRICGGVLNWKQ